MTKEIQMKNKRKINKRSFGEGNISQNPNVIWTTRYIYEGLRDRAILATLPGESMSQKKNMMTRKYIYGLKMCLAIFQRARLSLRHEGLSLKKSGVKTQGIIMCMVKIISLFTQLFYRHC